jgi:hypothetical protein
MKKLIVYGPIAMALIAALAVGIPAAVAADTSDEVSSETSTTTTSDGQKPGQELISKVAEILNIDEATVNDAFQQATQELSSEALQQRLTKAVEDGTITQEEADQIIAWMNTEPAAVDNLGQGWLNGLTRPSSSSGTANLNAPTDMGNGFPNMGPSGNFSDSQPAHMDNVPRGNKLSTEEQIQNAVDSGTITQAEADEITTWISVMPDAMTKIGSLQHNGHMGPSDADFYSPPF